MDSGTIRTEIVNLDISSISSRKEITTIKAYCTFPSPNESTHTGGIWSSVLDAAMALYIWRTWRTSGTSPTSGASDHMDFERSLNLWNNARCKVNCLEWIETYCLFGNASFYPSCVSSSTIVVQHIYWRQLNLTDCRAFYRKFRCDLPLPPYKCRYTVS